MLINEDYEVIKSLLDIQNEFNRLSLITSLIDNIKDIDYIEPEKERLIAALAALKSKIGATSDILKADEDKGYLKEISNSLSTLKENLLGEKGIVERQGRIIQSFKEYEIAINKTNNKIEGIIKEINGLVKSSEEEAERIQDTTLSTLKGTIGVIMVTFLISIAVGVFISIILIKGVVSPIKGMVNLADKVSSGDLSTVLNYESNDEIGKMGSGFNKMIEKIKEVIVRISTLTETIADNSIV